jgi:hypothetical protein
MVIGLGFGLFSFLIPIDEPMNNEVGKNYERSINL